MTTFSSRAAVPPPTAVAAGAASSTSRLLSLDVVRGVAIAAMLVMNHPGSWDHMYPALQHAEWHGWTPTDLVFPLFLFVVGTSMVFSFGAALSRRRDRPRILLRAARRAAVLVLLGLILVTFPWWHLDPAGFRIPGVLQRIGAAFLIATPIVLWLRPRGQAIAAAALLLGYWAIMRWIPVPGVGAAVWQPGHDVAAFFDHLVLGAHLLHGDWDPLGILGTLPAAANVLVGALAGQWVRSGRPGRSLVTGLIVAGTAAMVLGAIWDAAFPINKSLWTSSYAVFSAGFSLLVLGSCYWAIELRGYRRWAQPFAVLGLNAILIYVAASLLDAFSWRIPVGSGHSLRSVTYNALFEQWLAPMHASLAFSLTFVVAWILVAAVLARSGIRLKF
jgi:predicted acyltransferase